MEASLGFFNPLNLNRPISSTVFTKTHSLRYLTGINLPYRSPPPPLLLHVHRSRKISLSPLSVITAISRTTAHSSFLSFPNSYPLGFPLSHSSSCSKPDHFNNMNRLNTCLNDGGSIIWYGASKPINGDGASALGERDCLVTAVLLGWLGAEPKHLKRYAEIYTSKGMSAVTFAVSVRNLLRFDLGRSVQNRISELMNQLALWLMKPDSDGRERCLIFHVFSNTGWLAYGAILSRLQDKPDLLKKIRGCIVDSGGAPELNPQIWAAGFGAALLKKRNQAVNASVEGGELDVNGPKMMENMISTIEILLLLFLEAAFSFILKLPDVNRRLTKILLVLSENQPYCPQLYLYSTADKIIPFRSVELFMEEQRRAGRMIYLIGGIGSILPQNLRLECLNN
ncbi:hypothetical protein Nepgr_025878 [Nepenthes gracilis]|uniref:Transmembrane protein 53 n=1 Tax=Nepenthes gracilis TaxID=150966 RepID=A0AAD3T5Y4_NEPGR|nr:hypothetical protein Nepgr_025878 [Nepenthes gracilis]